MKVLTEFKEFAVKGNVIDLAVGIIIGAAFGKVVSSLVSDIIMPPIGLLISNVDFKDLAYVIGGTAEVPISIKYGLFIQTLLDFVIVAFSIFMAVKVLNKMKKEEKKEEAKKDDSITESN